VLVSCAVVPVSYPTNETITAAKFPQPTNEEAFQQIMSSMYMTYKDPDSIMIRDLQVREFGAIDLASGSPTFGYKVSFLMNAKNGRGAYNGYNYYEYLVTKARAIEIIGIRLNTATFEFVPQGYFYFHSESDLRRKAPPSQIPAAN
jgi:hypothetical protein